MRKVDLEILKHDEWIHFDENYHLALNDDAPVEAQPMWQEYLKHLREVEQSDFDY